MVRSTQTKPYTPSFTEDHLVSTFKSYRETRSLSADSCREVERGQLLSCRAVVAHFEQDQGSSFFADPATLAALAREMSSLYPAWRERLLARVVADRKKGLKIYSLTGPLLQPGFPWGGLASEPNHDDLYSIRPHRFGFVPRHALAVLYGGESADVLADILEDWMTFAARGRSEFPYCSALVVIQRLLSLSWARAFVMALPGSDEPAKLRLHADILRIVHADIGFLLPRLGKSAPNNHLLADRFASWYIRLLYPEFVGGQVDLDLHEAAWLGELERQVYPDGTGFEHSLHYHEFACEMAAAYVLLCRRNSRPIPQATLERVKRMLGFQVELAGPDCVLTPFGDATEDPLFNLDSGDGWGTAGLRELYRALFRPELSPAPAAIPAVERAFWLLGGAFAPRRLSSSGGGGEPRVWVDGGVCVLPDEPSSARLIFRTGPTRYHDLVAGHMHADLLSVYLTHGDQLVLTDAGTWSYRWRSSDTGPARSYFSGPMAHNGPAIDAIDPLGAVQSEFRKQGIPVRVSTTCCLLGDRLSWLEAVIRGHAPYTGHRRGVVHIAGEYWVIYDVLPAGIGMHAVTLGFQAAVGVEATQQEPGTVWLKTSDGASWIAAGPGLEGPRIVQGEFDPPGGWVAPAYGELTPAAQLRYSVAKHATVTAVTLGASASVATPIAVHATQTGLMIATKGSGIHDHLFLATHNEAITVSVAGRHGHAAAVWMRMRSERPEVLRCLGFRETKHDKNNSPDGRQEPAAGAMFRIDDAGQEIEYREPRELSISFLGHTWP